MSRAYVPSARFAAICRSASGAVASGAPIVLQANLHTYQARAMDDTRRSAAARAPTSASLNRYRRLYIHHVWRTQRAHHTKCPLDPTWAWWAAWTPDERARFFHALGRHSRQRPDLVAHDVRTKSLLDVTRVIRTFDKHVRRLKREERAHRRGEAWRHHMLSLCPPARELSDEWLAWEESHAHLLAQRSDPRAEPSPRPISVAEQLFDMAWFLYHSRPPALRQGRHTEGTETLASVVGRLVQLPKRADMLHTGPVTMTEAYVAWAKQYPVPPLYTFADVQKVLCLLFHHGYMAWSDAHDAVLEGEAPLLLTPTVVWIDAQCCPPLPHDLHDVLSMPALERHCKPEQSVPYTTWAGLAHELYAFLVPLLYDVITVAERSHPHSSIDEAAIWAAVARRGCLPPMEASTTDTDEAPPTGPLGLNRDLLDTMAQIRAITDPPVAWLHRPPTQTPGLVHEGRERVAETFDETSRDSVCSDESDTDASWAQASEADEDVHPTQLGAFRTLVPYEFVQGSSSPSEASSPNEVPSSPSEAPLSPTEAKEYDESMERADAAHDATYEARLWREWVE